MEHGFPDRRRAEASVCPGNDGIWEYVPDERDFIGISALCRFQM